MNLSEKIAERDPNPYFTFEFFPPRTDQGFTNLLARIGRLSSTKPLAVSITWGAGGSTKDRSLELAGLAQTEYGIDTILHLTCTNMERGMVDNALREAKKRGIRNILALRGDPPRGEEYWIPTDPRFTRAADLVSYIKSTPEFAKFCVGVAAYPDGHSDHDFPQEVELQHLKAKVDAGADFIITQLFYDVDAFLVWQDKVHKAGISIPIIPGIMPMHSYGSFQRLKKLCGVQVPPSLESDLEAIRHDDQKVKDFGVEYITSMIKTITSKSEIRGFHFCTLNLERSVHRVLENLGWVGGPRRLGNKLITDSPDLSPTPDSKIYITPLEASTSATSKFVSTTFRPTVIARSESAGTTTWDEFPNGHFGDFTSPAFGNQDPWNAGLRVTPSDGLTQWGHPRSEEDLTQLFVSYLLGKISMTPFSPWPLAKETLTILDPLHKLTLQGWWTVGSQPAVDGISSSDENFGWGPKGGYVFQKSFVEFFASKEDVDRLASNIKENGNGIVDFFASNYKGEVLTNVPENGRNIVTWGIFPNREIISSTVIEKESFLAWKDEAFTIWSQFALFYPPDSFARKFLEGIRQKRWLVSVVHHDFKEADALWTFLNHE